MSTPRAYAQIEDREDEGMVAVLYGEDEEGTVELDTGPANEGEWEGDVARLNAHPDELAGCMRHARNGTGAWAPREGRT